MAVLLEESVLVQLKELAKLAYSHFQQKQQHEQAEINSINELKKFAALNHISRDAVKEALMEVGYKPQTAAVYASQVNSIQQDPDAMERLQKTGSFAKAKVRATRNRKENDPEMIPRILRGGYREAARLAKKYDVTLEDHLKYSEDAYSRAK